MRVLSCSSNTQSRTTAPLAEDPAWAIATAWCDHLHGTGEWHKLLRLKTDTIHSNELALVQSYEWVKIKVTTEQEAAIARAAVTAWFWLSCCPGYSGVENPVFWKRVFSHLQLHQEDKHAHLIMDRMFPSTDSSITDAVRFFDQPGREFPRIRLKAPSVSTSDAFVGTRVGPVDSGREKRLAEIYAYLRPFMIASRLQRPIPVAVESKNWDDKTTSIHPTGSSEPHAVMSGLPRFVVHSRLLHAWPLQLEGVANARLSDARLDVKTIKYRELWQDLEPSSIATTAIAIRSVLGLDSQHEIARIKTLQLDRVSLPAALLASVCSALPHAKRVTTVRMPTPTSSRHPMARGYIPSFRDFTAMDWAWIGYAIFHPDAQTSTWRVLDIGLDDLTPEAANVLRLMATGNNLGCVESQSTVPTSRFYHTARLSEATTVRLTASLSSEALIDVDENASVCLVVDSDEVDVARLEKWVRVIVAGVGFGWLLSATIAGVDSRAPGKSCLQGLSIYIADDERVAEATIELIDVVGENLMRLHTEAWDCLDSDTLTRLIRMCPALTMFSVSLSSSTSLTVFGTLPLLEELRLIMRTNHQDPQLLLPADPPSGKLRALHVHTERNSTQEHHAFVRTLLATYPKLEYLNWGEPYYAGFVDKYVDGRNSTRTALGDTADLMAFYQPVNQRARVALASVVCAKREVDPTNALTRVDRNVFKQIIDYAGTSGARDLWIR